MSCRLRDAFVYVSFSLLPRALEGTQGPGDLGSAPTGAERRSEPRVRIIDAASKIKRDAFACISFYFITCVRGFESLRNPQTIDFTALLHPPFKMEQEMEQMHTSSCTLSKHKSLYCVVLNRSAILYINLLSYNFKLFSSSKKFRRPTVIIPFSSLRTLILSPTTMIFLKESGMLRRLRCSCFTLSAVESANAD